eukprot:9775902-Heterocapsa_arctica.AAC.1
MLSAHLDDIRSGVCRACADDVGMVLCDIVHLLPVSTIFKLARLIAGLQLKFAKCTAVPLRPWSEALCLRIRDWLTANLPTWSAISIAPFT